MSWMISNALMKDYENSHFSLVQEEEYSPENFSDGEPSAQSSENPTPLAYLQQDRMTAFLKLSRSGQTFAPLTESLGEDLLTWYLEGFHAKTSVHLVADQELKEPSQACGSTWQESLAKYDLSSRTWRTVHSLFPEDLPWSSVILPRWGTMRNGDVYQRQAWEPITSGIESGSLLPTPTCHNAKEGAYPAEYARNTPTLATHVGGKIHPNFVEWMMGWPENWTKLKSLCNIDHLSNGEKYVCESKELRILRSCNGSAEMVKWEAGFSFSPETILLREVLRGSETSNGCTNGQCWKEASPESISPWPMREMPKAGRGEASQGRESKKQRISEHRDFVQELSFDSPSPGDFGSQDDLGKDLFIMRESVPSQKEEIETMRRSCLSICTRTSERNDKVEFWSERLKAVGNGQVPIVAATAFDILSK